MASSMILRSFHGSPWVVWQRESLERGLISGILPTGTTIEGFNNLVKMWLLESEVGHICIRITWLDSGLMDLNQRHILWRTMFGDVRGSIVDGLQKHSFLRSQRQWLVKRTIVLSAFVYLYFRLSTIQKRCVFSQIDRFISLCAGQISVFVGKFHLFAARNYSHFFVFFPSSLRDKMWTNNEKIQQKSLFPSSSSIPLRDFCWLTS
jgi:hypothetical protein